MSGNEDEVRKCYISMQNIIKILKYRKYKNIPYPSITIEEFYEKYESKTISEIKSEMSNELTREKKILIVWVSDSKLNGNKINEIYNDMETLECKHVMIITDYSITPTAVDVVRYLKSTGIKIEIWTFDQTMLFVPDHVLVPEHKICSEKYKNNVYEKYALDNDSIPKITPDDIMVKYLDAKKGQLIEIKRKSETADEQFCIEYRIVSA